MWLHQIYQCYVPPWLRQGQTHQIYHCYVPPLLRQGQTHQIYHCYVPVFRGCERGKHIKYIIVMCLFSVVETGANASNISLLCACLRRANTSNETFEDIKGVIRSRK